MSLNYAIFRSSPIYTLKDLAGIGSHNKREKKECLGIYGLYNR